MVLLMFHSTFKAMRILILDDDKEYIALLKEIIEHDGFTVEITDSPIEALNMQNRNPFDLIITDIIMPEMDGLEVIQYIKATHPKTRIIAISGGGYFNANDLLVMAKEFGANMVIPKPINFSILKSQLHSLSAI